MTEAFWLLFVVTIILAVAACTLRVRLQHALAQGNIPEVANEDRIRLERAYRGAGVGLWEWTKETNGFWGNQRCFDLFCLHPLNGKPVTFNEFESRLHEQDRQRVLNAFNTHLTQRTPYSEIYRIVLPDGTIRWIEAFGQADWDTDGVPISMSGTVVDVTDRVSLEQQLRHAETRYAQLADNSPDVYWFYDLSGTQSFHVSSGAERITGRTPTELANSLTSFLSFIHPEDRERIRGKFMQLSVTGTYNEEYRMVHTDGSIRWMHDRGFVIRDDHAQPIRFAGIAQDISKRKFAEFELREATKRLETVLDQLPLWIGLTDLNGIITWVNRIPGAIYQFQVADLVGKPLWEGPWLIGQPTGQQAVRLALEKVLQGLQTRIDVDCVLPDGSTAIMDAIFAPRYDTNGKLVEIVSSGLDVTERRKAENRLRENEQRLELAEEIGQLGSWELDLATGNATWSRNMHRIVGREPGQGVYESAKFSATFIHPDDIPAITKNWQIATQKPEAFEQEFRICREDGRIVTVESRLKPIFHPDGQLNKWTGTFLDITERKTTERLLAKQAAELQRSNDELQQFAYVASHDLQEPLRMVTSYLNLLSNRYQGKLDEKADKYIRYAVDGAARMRELIEDLLEYSRVQTQEQTISTVNVREKICIALANLNEVIQERRATITVGDMPTIQADRTQLVQVFQNLIGNAIKFCTQEPIIQVTSRLEQNEWIFSVTDNGIGIAKEHQERIFLMFQRLHPIGTHPGTGIGLAVCKKVIERHGGRIWVESQPGVGSTFSFSIPLLARVTI